MPRRLLALAVATALGVPALVAMPVLAPADRDPVPVSVQRIPLSGVDPAALAAGPPVQARHLTPDHGHSGITLVADEVVDLEPAVATPKLDTEEFGLVGITSDSPIDPDSRVLVRVRENGAWGEWNELALEPDHGPDPSSPEAADARHGTEPLLVERGDGVQVRIDTPDGTVPASTEVALVDNPVTPEDASLAPALPLSTAQAATSQPPIISRAEWGADESKRSRDPLYSDTIKVGFVHHTTGWTTYRPDQAAQIMRNLYGYYTDVKHYSDMAYNFLVDRFGRLYEGRAGGIEKAVIGGHTAGFNDRTFAVSAIGDFDEYQPTPTEMEGMTDSISSLLAWKLGLYHRNPLGSTTLVSDFGGGTSLYEPGEVARTTVIAGHGEIGNTACPGRYLRAQLPTIREKAAALMGPAIFDPVIRGSGADWGSGESITLSGTTTIPVTWRLDIRNACNRRVRSLTGTQEAAGTLQIPWNLKGARGRQLPPGTYSFHLTVSDGTTTGVPWNGTAEIDATSDSPANPCEPPSEFRVIGSGYGHGVGLSQWGAYGMAVKGRTVPQIMSTYFPGSTLTSLQDDQTIRIGLLHQVATAQLRSERLPGAPDTETAPVEVDLGRNVTVGDRRDVFSFAASDQGVTVTRTRKGVTTALGTAESVVVRWGGTREPGSTGSVPSLVNVIGPDESFSTPRHRYRYGIVRVATVSTSNGPRLAVVNPLRLRDEYLFGIAEVNAMWPQAALQAQVIASRSYALSTVASGLRSACKCHADDGGGPYYDQTFWGYARETETGGANWVKAVRGTFTGDTAGQALVYDGKVVRATYTASTGGFTRTAKDVWGGNYPWSVSVDDHWSVEAPGNPYNNWSRTVSQSSMAQLFGLENVMSVVIAERDAAGVPTVIRATSSSGATAERTAGQVRSAYGLLSSYISDVTWPSKVTTDTPPSVTLTASPSTVRSGRSVTLSGVVTPAQAGLRVVRQISSATGWRTLSRTTTDAKGAFAFTISGIAPAGKTYRYRVIVSDNGRTLVTSKRIRVAVT